jgi:hypothetical protein
MARRAKGDIRTTRHGINRAIHGGFHRLASRQGQAKPNAEQTPPQFQPAAVMHHAAILPDWPRRQARRE